MTKPNDKLKQIMQSFPLHTQVSMCLIVDSKRDYIGAINTEQGVEFVENRTAVYEIGSISKVLTSTVLSSLIESGLLSLDDSVAALLGLELNKNSDISLRALATHTSGLPVIPLGLLLSSLFKSSDNPYKDFDEGRLLSYLQTKMRLSRVGKFRYSNIGAGLLLYVLSRRAKLSYAELYQQCVFSPFSMLSSTIDKHDPADALVLGRGRKGQLVPNWDLGALVGAGGVLSNVADLGEYLLANFNPENRVLHAQRQEYENISADLSVGLAWLILKKEIVEQRVLFHNGGTGGYSSAIALEPINKNAVIVLSNVSAFSRNRGMVDELAISTLAAQY